MARIGKKRRREEREGEERIGEREGEERTGEREGEERTGEEEEEERTGEEEEGKEERKRNRGQELGEGGFDHQSPGVYRLSQSPHSTSTPTAHVQTRESREDVPAHCGPILTGPHQAESDPGGSHIVSNPHYSESP